MHLPSVNSYASALSILSLLHFFFSKPSHASLQVLGYNIDNSCDTEGPNPRGVYLAHTLYALIAELQIHIIGDANLGTDSDHGFTSFFKTNINKLRVVSIFEKIQRGDFLSNSCINDNQPTQINFHCVDADAPDSPDARDCENHAGVVSFVKKESQATINLCPLFWGLRDRPETRFCPRVRRNEMTHSSLIIDRMGFLIHDLANIYGATPFANTNCSEAAELEGSFENKEAYDAQECAELSAEQQVQNAQNYAFYASSVIAGCTNFYQPPPPPVG